MNLNQNISLRLLAEKYDRMVHHAADRLSYRTKHFSVHKQKIVLIIFCMLSGATCICTIISSVHRHAKSSTEFFAQPVYAPSHIGKSFVWPEPIISKEIFDRVEEFKRHLDSIAGADTSAYHQLMIERPGLTDSIKQFEMLYYSQPKK